MLINDISHIEINQRNIVFKGKNEKLTYEISQKNYDLLYHVLKLTTSRFKSLLHTRDKKIYVFKDLR